MNMNGSGTIPIVLLCVTGFVKILISKRAHTHTIYQNVIFTPYKLSWATEYVENHADNKFRDNNDIIMYWLLEVYM